MQPKTILDRDIEAYTAFTETEQARLQRCLPSEESMQQMRYNACAAVLAALKVYKHTTEVAVV